MLQKQAAKRKGGVSARRTTGGSLPAGMSLEEAYGRLEAVREMREARRAAGL